MLEKGIQQLNPQLHCNKDSGKKHMRLGECIMGVLTWSCLEIEGCLL